MKGYKGFSKGLICRGNRSAATSTGNYSAATNTGDCSAATNTGEEFFTEDDDRNDDDFVRLNRFQYRCLIPTASRPAQKAIHDCWIRTPKCILEH